MARPDLSVYCVHKLTSVNNRLSPVWAVAIYDEKDYQYYWSKPPKKTKSGSDGKDVNCKSIPLDDKVLLLGLIAAGAQVRYMDITGHYRRPNVFVARTQDDVVYEGISFKQWCKSYRKPKEEPPEDEIRELGRYVLTQINEAKRFELSEFYRPSAEETCREIKAKLAKEEK